MRILEKRFTFIHTHFLTDCEKLPYELGRELQRDMERFLREKGIVYGIHFEETKSERGIRIVLECVPLPRVLEEVESHLRELIKPIPRRPRPVRTVRVEEPPHSEAFESEMRRLGRRQEASAARRGAGERLAGAETADGQGGSAGAGSAGAN